MDNLAVVPFGERSVAREFRKAIARGRRLIYLEDQFLWSTEVARIFAAALVATLTFKDDDVKGKIEAEVGIRPAFALEAFGNLEADVKQSIARIEASPFIPNKESVRGFVYDVRTGQLDEMRAQAGVR